MSWAWLRMYYWTGYLYEIRAAICYSFEMLNQRLFMQGFWLAKTLRPLARMASCQILRLNALAKNRAAMTPLLGRYPFPFPYAQIQSILLMAHWLTSACTLPSTEVRMHTGLLRFETMFQRVLMSRFRHNQYQCVAIGLSIPVM